LFEHLIVTQILTLNATLGEPARLSTYRTEAGSEVDLIIEKDGETMSLEIKAGTRVSSSDFSGLRRFGAPAGRKRLRSLLLYAGSRAYREGDVSVLPWRHALKEIEDFLT
jgi:hypothetical protein